MSANKNKRPTSPHLQIYKPQITSITSILHRATGLFLYFSFIFLALFIAYNLITYGNFTKIINKFIYCNCKMMYFILYSFVILFSFSLYYHLFNGVRHLLFNINKGIDIKSARFTGHLVIILSLLFTLSIPIILFNF